MKIKIIDKYRPATFLKFKGSLITTGLNVGFSTPMAIEVMRNQKLLGNRKLLDIQILFQIFSSFVMPTQRNQQIP
jgi:hypothetical protein